MATLAQLEEALLNAHEAGDEAAARTLAGEIVRIREGGEGAEDAFRRELRDAITTRQATIDDLRGIAQRYNRELEDPETAQAWIDYAADNPEFDLPADLTTPPTSRLAATLSGIERHLRPFGEFAEQLDPVAHLFKFAEDVIAPGRREERETALENRNVQEAARAQEQYPNWFTGGGIAGDIIGTAPAIFMGGAGLAGGGAALATRAPTAGRILQNFGRAVQTGGTGVRAPGQATVATAPVAATRKGRIALRTAGGAASGVGSAALTGQDLSDAALTGAAFPLAATVARRGAGKTYDFLRGRIGDTRAAAVMRNLFAERSAEIMDALRNAPADARANTAQWLAARGLMTPELAAATSIGEASGFSKPLRETALARDAARNEMLAALRGGETQAEAVSNINTMRARVRARTKPMLDAFMERADIGRTQILPAEREATRLRGAAAEEAKRAARFYRAADEQSMVLNQMDDLGDPFGAEAINRQRGVVGALESRGLAMGQRSVDLGEQARNAQEIADNLRAQGLQPLDVSGVVNHLRDLAREAAAVSPQRANLFNAYATALQDRADMYGGVIDATGLHLAKRDISEFVANTLGQSDPSALQRGTSLLAGEVRSLIDDAFEEAAGPGWGAYNRAFSEGMRRVEQQEFARQLTRLTPARFNEVMRGDRPEFVSKFFFGQNDVNNVLTPGQRGIAQRLNQDIASDLEVSDLGLRTLPRELRGQLPTGESNSVLNAIEPGLPPATRGMLNVLGRIPGLSGGGLLTEDLARQYAQAVARNTMRSLTPALANPAEAFRLAQQRSTNAMMSGAIDRLNPFVQALGAQAAQQYLRAGPLPAPAAAPDTSGITVYFPNAPEYNQGM